MEWCCEGDRRRREEGGRREGERDGKRRGKGLAIRRHVVLLPLLRPLHSSLSPNSSPSIAFPPTTSLY